LSGLTITAPSLLGLKIALSFSGTWNRKRSFSLEARSLTKSMRVTLTRSYAVPFPQMASTWSVEAKIVCSASGTSTTKSKFRLSSATRTQSHKSLSTRTMTNSTLCQTTGRSKFGIFARCATWTLIMGITRTSCHSTSTPKIA